MNRITFGVANKSHDAWLLNILDLGVNRQATMCGRLSISLFCLFADIAPKASENYSWLVIVHNVLLPPIFGISGWLIKSYFLDGLWPPSRWATSIEVNHWSRSGMTSTIYRTWICIWFFRIAQDRQLRVVTCPRVRVLKSIALVGVCLNVTTRDGKTLLFRLENVQHHNWTP